jgi:xanthine dehydrogenase accessory factor
MARMRDVLDDLDRLRARGERIAIATVVATRQSAPRPVGSKLVVSEGGELLGSVSGGCVESEVYEACREVLAGGSPQVLTYGISDEQALRVGLPCGGEIDVEVHEPDAAVLDELGAVIREGVRAVAFTDLGDGAQWVVREGSDAAADALLREGTSRVVEMDGRSVFAEVLGPPPRLLVFGAVDTAEALCGFAKQLGWRTVVSDARSRFATRERLPSADEIVVAWPGETLARAQPDHATAVVVLTHDEKFDIPALLGALETEAFYIGALGSRRTQAKRRERLLEEGVDEEQLNRLRGPAGLDIGGHTPAETALSMLAEILAVRAGREGGPLRESAHRIHAEV